MLYDEIGFQSAIFGAIALALFVAVVALAVP